MTVKIINFTNTHTHMKYTAAALLLATANAYYATGGQMRATSEVTEPH